MVVDALGLPLLCEITEGQRHVHGLRRTATDLLRRAAVDPVTAKAIIGHTTDRMREHYSTVGTDEARGIGARLVSLVPAVTATKIGGG